jgi:hypothetical protein
MAKRTGVWTLTTILQQLCKYITQFRPILMIISNNDPALTLALNGAMSACEALDMALQPYKNPQV